MRILIAAAIIYFTVCLFGQQEDVVTASRQTVEIVDSDKSLSEKQITEKEIVITKKELDCFVRILYGESRKCYPDAYKVAQVIYNRFRNDNYHDFIEVISEPKQFSSYMDKNYKSIKPSSQEYLALKNIVIDVLGNNVPDSLVIPRTCENFVNPSYSSWIPDKRVISVSDNNHHYYDE